MSFVSAGHFCYQTDCPEKFVQLLPSAVELPLKRPVPGHAHRLLPVDFLETWVLLERP